MTRYSVTALVTFLLLAGTASATLTTIGTAMYGDNTYNLVYDEDSPFGSTVWLDYTRSGSSWGNQMSWVNTLNTPNTLRISIDDGYVVSWDSGWRLPQTLVGSNVFSFDGSTPYGYNDRASEFGHLFYTELGNLGSYNSNGIPQNGWGLTKTGVFTNLLPSWYWSSTQEHEDSLAAWNFSTYHGGYQSLDLKEMSHQAIAVRSAHVDVVPEPSTFILLGAGLGGFALYRRRRKER